MIESYSLKQTLLFGVICVADNSSVYVDCEILFRQIDIQIDQIDHCPLDGFSRRVTFFLSEEESVS